MWLLFLKELNVSQDRYINREYNTVIQFGKNNDRRMTRVLGDTRVRTQTQPGRRIGESFLGAYFSAGLYEMNEPQWWGAGNPSRGTSRN